MKHLLTALIAIVLSLVGYSQHTETNMLERLTPQQQQEANIYLQNATKAKVTGVASFCGGVALLIAGSTMNINTGMYNSWGQPQHTSSRTGELITVAGAITTMFGIHSFIRGCRFSNYARAIIYSEPGLSLDGKQTLPNSQYTGIRIIIQPGK